MKLQIATCIHNYVFGRFYMKKIIQNIRDTYSGSACCHTETFYLCLWNEQIKDTSTHTHIQDTQQHIHLYTSTINARSFTHTMRDNT